MNELVKKQDLETALQEEIASGGGFGPLLKFDANTSKYTIDKNEVPVGRKFIVHIPQYARGWVLFRDKSPIEYKVYKITEGKPPGREELDSAIADSDDDGWVYQRYLPLEDYDTSELIGRQDRNRKFDPGLHGAPSRRPADHLPDDQRLSHPRIRPQAATGLQIDWLDQRPR